MTAAALQHARREAHDQAQRAEIVELHGTFVIMKAIEGVLHRAPDGTPGVVDQDIHLTVILQHLSLIHI